MSNFRRCLNCKEYGWFDGSFMDHKCSPAWECRPEWHGDDDGAWSTVHAVDAEAAAEKAAERYDCNGGEYVIVSNRMRGDCVFQVRKLGEDTFERWSIEAEAVPTYSATKSEPLTLPRPDGGAL